ncbi:hypothetical protein [Abyssibacter sp.]|uniref:hypothetical protein n=1 Tax=Abyssibacter sp. TaxID=2320200 RepID=UPI000C4B3B0C|nr:hypothetical protein [Abyssibacter sp.]MBB87926.1 plasmid stability protein [Xanthomonadales bacterium]MCK5857715.1 hypothetical protein [Abyssibacter sp.]
MVFLPQPVRLSTPAITAKPIPDALYKPFKASAQAGHRGINRERIHRLEASLTPQNVSARSVIASARLLRDRVDAGRLDPIDFQRAKREGRG